MLVKDKQAKKGKAKQLALQGQRQLDSKVLKKYQQDI